MKKAFLPASALILLLFSVSVASADEFSADMKSTMDGRVSKGKMFVSGKKIRMETEGNVTIYRPDKKVMWIVMDKDKSYMEMPIDESQLPKTEEKVKGEMSRKHLGAETVNGYKCDKYEVTYKPNKGKSETMLQWISKDMKFPVKTADTKGKWTTEFSNIKKSAPGDVFDPPKGYKKMQMPSFPGMGGMGGFGGMGK